MFVRKKVSVAAVVLTLTGGCAPARPRTAEAPAVRPAGTPATAGERAAFAAERELNAAELALEQLQPEAAEPHLRAATAPLEDPALESYPEAAELRARQARLGVRIPEVREEVRRREVAARLQPARARVEEARAALAAELESLGRGRPSEADLKRCTALVRPVREALSAAIELEAEDPDYSQYAAETRRGLDEVAATIERRRLEVAMANRKDAIESEQQKLLAALPALEQRDASDAQFEQARAAANELEAALDRGREVAGDDPAYARFLAAGRAELTARRGTIEQRQHKSVVGRQRAAVEDAREHLGAALERLRDADVSEATFEEAEAALDAVKKQLDEGGELAEQDRKYVQQVNKRLDEIRAKLGARRIEVASAHARATVEARRARLAEALRGLKARAPAEEDFEQAAASITEVERALEAPPAGALIGKDARFAGYVASVRAAMKSARTALATRRSEVEVDRARAAITEAAAALKRAVAALPHLDEVASTEDLVAELEKRISAGARLPHKDATYVRAAGDARALVASARTGIRERRDALATDGARARVKADLAAVTAAVNALDATPDDTHFHAAADAIRGARGGLQASASLERKVARYHEYAQDARKRLRAAEERIDKRKLAVALRDRRGAADQALAAAKAAVTHLRGPGVTAADVDAASTALGALRKAIAAGSALERSDQGYARFLDARRKQVDALRGEIEDARHRIAFRSGPVAALTQGLESAEMARGSGPDEQKRAYRQAADRFRTCKSGGTSLLALYPRLGTDAFAVGRERLSGAGVLMRCGDRAKSAEAHLKALSNALSLNDRGPRNR